MTFKLSNFYYDVFDQVVDDVLLSSAVLRFYDEVLFKLEQNQIVSLNIIILTLDRELIYIATPFVFSVYEINKFIDISCESLSDI